MIDDACLRHIASGKSVAITPEMMRKIAAELLSLRQENTRLKQLLTTEVKLPYVSASPVCDIEAGYAAGVTDSKEAIRRAGFFIEGDY